jgi:hypothetical protein
MHPTLFLPITVLLTGKKKHKMVGNASRYGLSSMGYSFRAWGMGHGVWGMGQFHFGFDFNLKSKI